MNRSTALRRIAAFAVPVAAGVAVLAALVAAREPPARNPPAEQVHAVRVLTLERVDAVPRATGFGEVQPAVVWQGVAEVSGRIVERHPRLDPGAILEAGTELFAIDPTRYRLAVTRIEADMRATEARIAESRASEENTRRSLAIEAESLAASEAELARLDALLAQGSVSRSRVDEQRRATLAQRQNVQQQRNALDLLPAQRRALQAELERQRAELESARLDLAHTRLTLPMDARIADAGAERDQFVREGETLVSADGIARAEVSAQVPIGQVRGLVALPPDAVFDPTDPELIDRIGLEATVEPAGLGVRWAGEVVRFDPGVDPQTRTVGVVVAVDEPYRRARPGERPPLVKGMFARVAIYGPPLRQAVVVPPGRVRDGAVWIVDGDDRLRRRTVAIALAQPEFTVIADGLAPGDRLVLGDLPFAIEGMRLAPENDAEAAEALRRAAGAPRE